MLKVLQVKEETEFQNSGLKEYKLWVIKQLHDYKEILSNWIKQGDLDYQIPAIRGILEVLNLFSFCFHFCISSFGSLGLFSHRHSNIPYLHNTTRIHELTVIHKYHHLPEIYTYHIHTNISIFTVC